MNAKIKDLEFKDKGFNQKIAYVWVTGKSGKRKKMLYDSLSYLRDWLNHGNHPTPENPNAYIFYGVGGRNKGRKLERHTFSHLYLSYKTQLFKKLSDPIEKGGDPTVPEEDKKIIKEKMLTKPMRPYILRYTALTEKSNKMSEFELREHADWTATSPMPRRYLRFRGDESINALMKAQGIISEDSDPIGSNGEERKI